MMTRSYKQNAKINRPHSAPESLRDFGQNLAALEDILEGGLSELLDHWKLLTLRPEVSQIVRWIPQFVPEHVLFALFAIAAFQHYAEKFHPSLSLFRSRAMCAIGTIFPLPLLYKYGGT